MTHRICKYCGKPFESKNGKRYCDRPHFYSCMVCGKKIEFFGAPPNIFSCCSPECTKKKREITSVKKYGTRVPAMSSEVRKKLSEASIQSLESRKRHCLEKYGVENPSSLSEVREKIRKSVTSETCQNKMKSTNLERYGVPYAMQNRDLFLKQSKSAKSVCCDGTVVDSRYEQVVYDFCVRNNLEFFRQIPITYQYEGTEHISYIDFCIQGILFECKGGHLLQGIYDEVGIPISRKLQLYREHHVVVITELDSSDLFGRPNSTESNGFRYDNKCKNPLIGVDVDLFNNPSFPYREDRSASFYDVKVSGQMSSHEAFFDESIRWNMIYNRIQYSGGFIDANQVLQALNVTRTCKQPSWFSVSFAKQILRDYSTSDIVVDPFAGWGARYDASVELGKLYVGCDISESLVTWHHSRGRDISLGDAKTFTYDKPCTVFICPPYQGVEVYVDNQDVCLTQCQWLSLVMKNVPNAREYILVCKIVDPGWERYIVQTKENKSHFGVNKEYVLVVPGSSSDFVLSDEDLLELRSQEAVHIAYAKSLRRNKLSKKDHRTWMYNSCTDEEKQISVQDVSLYLSLGWNQGRRFRGNFDLVWITNGTDEKRVKKERVSSFTGYHIGRLPSSSRGSKIVSNGSEAKMVPEEDVQEYISKGWILGYSSGQGLTDKTLVSKNGSSIYVEEGTVGAYLENGYMLGSCKKSTLVGRKHIYNPETLEERMVGQDEIESYVSDGWVVGRNPDKVKNFHRRKKIV